MKVSFLTYEALPTSKAAASRKVGGLNTIVFHLTKMLAALPETLAEVICCNKDTGQWGISMMGNVEITEIAPSGLLPSQSDSDQILERCAALLQRRLSDFPTNLIHTSGSEAGYIMASVRKNGLNIPWVHTNYATLAVRRVVVQGLPVTQAVSDAIAQREVISLRQCDHIIALSEVDKSEIHEVFGVNAAKITAISPGVDRSVFTPGEKFGREPLVVSAGRMSKIKDFPFLLRAFRSALEQSPETLRPKLAIIGGNNAEREELGLPQLAAALGIGRHVDFLDGMGQSMLARYFQKAKLFVGSSQHETFGLLPVEARACGTPSIVRANSSYLSAAKDGCGGYFADNRHEQDMANKIALVLSLKEPEWQAMSMAAIESASQYTWPSMAQGCMQVYKNISRRKLENSTTGPF